MCTPSFKTTSFERKKKKFFLKNMQKKDDFFLPLHKSKTTYIPRLNSIPFSFDYTMCTNNVYMVMKNRALIKGFFQLFFFLNFSAKSKKPTPSHITLHYPLLCPPIIILKQEKKI